MAINPPRAAESTEPAPPVPFESRKIAYLLVFFAVCYLAFLGHYPLIDPDEPVYAETGKLMALARGFAPWWTPHYNAQMWFDKPPLTYWVVGLSMRLLGVSELAARLPMALATLALVWVTACLARRIYPRSRLAPVWGAFAIGSCAQSLILAHACVTDMLLALSLGIALLNVWDWVSNPNWKSILFAGAAVGVGVMIKGPVAIVLIGALLLAYLAARKQILRFFSAQLWVSLALAFAIAAPWYISMVALHGRYFVSSFLEAQNVTRYLSAEHSSTASPLFFVPVLLAGFLPWTFALIPSLIASFRRARAGAAGDTFALIWIILVFVFFSASQSKLVTYIFPLYPLAACVTGYWIAESMRQRAGFCIALAAAFVVSAAFAYGIGMTWFPHGLAISTVVAAGMVGPIATAFIDRAVAVSRPKRTTHSSFAAAGLCLPPILLVALFPAAAAGPVWRHPDPKSLCAIDIARAVAANSAPGSTVYALTFDKPSLVYYSNRHIIFTDNQELLGPLLSRPPYPICVTKPDIIQSLERKRLLGGFRILAQTGSVVVLLRGDTGKAADEPPKVNRR